MVQIHNFQEARDALRQFYGPVTGEKRYTLDRIRRLMDFLGNPQNDLKIVHVAGTSGKTSTAYYAAALLQQAGFRVGLTVSPHVDGVNERVQINLTPMPEQSFCEALSQFLELIARSGIRPSYFELLIAFAFHEFKRQGVDYAVVEVGLGGLIDGTNVVTRADKICVITDIGLDHIEVLGDNLADIATQKAGIIQPRNHTFMHRQSPEVMGAVAERANQQNATLHEAVPVSPVETRLLPFFQQRNFELALTATNFILQGDGRPSLSPTQLAAAAATHIPARMEIKKLDKKTLIIDGAHNAQKVDQLLQSIKGKFGHAPLAVLAGFVVGLDYRWQEALDILAPQVSQLIFTSFYQEKDVPKGAVDPDRLVAYCSKKYPDANCTAEPNSAKAYQQLVNSSASLLLVVGSFYLLNDIRPLVR